MKLVGNTKKWRGKTKKGEHLPSQDVVKVFLVQFNFVDNQCQQKSEVGIIYFPFLSYAYLVNNEPNNLVFLKNYYTELDDIIITLLIKIVGC